MIDLLWIWLAMMAVLVGGALIITVLQILWRIGRLWFRWLRVWRHVPLVQKNHARAGFGAFLMVAAIGLAVYGAPVRDPFNGWGFASIAGFGFGFLYLFVGIVGSQGARFDFMTLFYFSVLGLACAVLLLRGLPV